MNNNRKVYGPYRHGNRWRYHVKDEVGSIRYLDAGECSADPRPPRWARQLLKRSRNHGGQRGGARHQELLARLHHLGVVSGGFAKEIRWRFAVETDVRPDGWLVVAGERLVECIEIEVSAPLSRLRLKRYAALSQAIEAAGWDMRLFVVDDTGDVSLVAFPVFFPLSDLVLGRRT